MFSICLAKGSKPLPRTPAQGSASCRCYLLRSLWIGGLQKRRQKLVEGNDVLKAHRQSLAKLDLMLFPQWIIPSVPPGKPGPFSISGPEMFVCCLQTFTDVTFGD